MNKVEAMLQRAKTELDREDYEFLRAIADSYDRRGDGLGGPAVG